MKIGDRLSIYRTNLFYLIIAIVFMLAGVLGRNLSFFSIILINEILIIALPSIYFIKRRGLSLKRTFRLNILGFKNIILIFFITILTYPIATFFQALFISIVNLVKPLNMEIPPLPIDITNVPFLLAFLFVAVLPGICEEIMFRGTILRTYEKIGIKPAIIISGVLFGLFHFNLINFAGPTVLGIVFGIMVYKTNSIYSSMLAHTINNSIALALNYIMVQNTDFVDGLADQQGDPSLIQTIAAFVIFGIFVIGLIKVIKILLSKLSSPKTDYEEIEDREVEADYIVKESVTFISYTPVLAVTTMFIIYNLIFIFK